MTEPSRRRFVGVAVIAATAAIVGGLVATNRRRRFASPKPLEVDGAADTAPDTHDFVPRALTVNGLRFDALSAGPATAPLVLLLHGFPQFADAWAPLMRRLAAAGYHAVALDQRGYSPGARPAEISDYSVAHLDADVLGFADALGAQRFHLVGHDWGGLLAWRAAVAHPERLLSVAVLSTPHPDAFLKAVTSNPDQMSRSKYIALFRAPGHLAEKSLLSFQARGLRAAYGGKLPPGAVTSNVKRLSAEGALTAALNWYRALNLDERIGKARVRSLYVWGDEDVALGEAAALDTANYVAAPYRFERLRHRSHWLLEDSPGEVASFVISHLRGGQRLTRQAPTLCYRVSPATFPRLERHCPMRLLRLLLIASLALPALSIAAAETDYHALALDIFKQLIEINTTDSVGSVTAAAEAMQQRLLAAGYPAADMRLVGPNDRKMNLVVRLHGSSAVGAKKPILFIGHLDVVEARRSDWTTDPFHFVEKDGFYYGRGTQDMKEGDAILVTTFIRLRQEGYRPDRDMILALTADEEGGKSNGVEWLIKNHRELIDAEYVLNSDGGGVGLQHGKPVVVEADATEKLYADFQLTAVNPGGHSSLPIRDNAIYHIADALGRLEQYEFPFELNAITRAYLQQMSTREPGQLGADIHGVLQTPQIPAALAHLALNAPYNAVIRTTCVATMLAGGHAPNALPQKATANVNCRILPGHSREEVRQQLIGVFHDSSIVVRYMADNGDLFDTAPAAKALPPAEIDPQVMAALQKLAAEMWPGAPVIPTMATGASDGIYTNAAGMPTYAITGIALEEDDTRAHGKDERLPVESFRRGEDFYYRFVKTVTGGKA